ncbi:MAG: epoxyqueuosine reductase QueH [Lachnospiraceae bacterium]|nr:epoxyqueuosine reductase QueH [Lachnospiraceae bacterium]
MIAEYKLKQMNDNQKMEEELKCVDELSYTPRLLLHSCCAPCSSHVISVLSPHFNITVLYYNPNIEPYEEYLKRKNEEIRFINEYPALNPIDIMDCDYDNAKFHEAVRGLEMAKEGGERCFICYDLRLDKTAALAKANEYDYFTTTLSVSPYKNAGKLNEIGLKLSEEYDINYLIADFKKKNGYKHSIEMSAEYNLYRQDYCGCVYSKRDRDCQKAEKNGELTGCAACKELQRKLLNENADE